MHSPSPLPYTDTKAVGAADFYTAINATFRFIENRFGLDGLRRYWTEMGASYFKPVSERWKNGGLSAVADYWQAFFAAEPGSEVKVAASDGMVKVCVDKCPAISHLRAMGREIVPRFCEQCYFVSNSIGQNANVAVRISGGNGRCVQLFTASAVDLPPQDLNEIETAS